MYWSRSWKRIALLAAGLAAVTAGAAALRGPAPPPPPASPPVAAPAAAAQDPLRPAELDRLSAAYLGVRYQLDPLGEERPPDTGPLLDRERVDCQTYVEQVLAEALSPTPAALIPTLNRLRYHGGEVRYERRFHFCIPEWLENPWPVRDVTPRIAGERLQLLEAVLPRDRFLEERGVSAQRAREYGPLPVRAGYLPLADVPEVAEALPHGALAVFLLRDTRLSAAGHMGFLFQREEGPVLRHASQTHGRVVDEPLLAYVQRRAARFRGLMVLQPEARN